MILKDNKLLTKYLSLGWVSCIGDALYYIALMTYAAYLDNPALGILIITISTLFPTAVDVILGALADSIKEKTLLIIKTGIFRGFIFLIIAFIISQSVSLTGLILIAILNAISGTAGTFSARLKSPFLRLIVHEDQLEKAIGINTGIRESLDVIAGFVGVIILGIIGIYYLAYFNALLFFIVSMGFAHIQKEMKLYEKTLTPPEFNGIKSLIIHIVTCVKKLYKIIPLRKFLLVGAALNGILGACLASFLISLTQNPEMFVSNFELSTSIAKGVLFVFGLAGAIIGPNLKKIGTTFILSSTLIVTIGYKLAIAVHLPWIAIAFICIGIFFATFFSIRLSSILMQSVPPEILGTMGSAFNIFLAVLPIPLTIFLNSLASISLPLYGILSAILCALLIVFILFSKLDKLDLKNSFLAYVQN